MLPNKAVADEPQPLVVALADESATDRFAQDVAMVAQPGWTVALHGDLGVGKTSFARAFIRALAGDPTLEVPSPTYTLVQPYPECQPAVVHADLYRIGDPGELDELGLVDPDEDAVRLVEWPQRAGEGAFADAIHLTLDVAQGGGRTARVQGPSDVTEALQHSADIRAFLTAAGFKAADRSRLKGDASSRRYEALRQDGNALILMDAPHTSDGPNVRVDLGPAGVREKPYSRLVHLAENVDAFVAVSAALRARGFAAPAIHAADRDRGLLVIDDLGSDGVLDPDRRPIPERYLAAAETLAALHAEPWPADLPIIWGEQIPDSPDSSGQKRDKRVERSTPRSAAPITADLHRLNVYNSTVFLTEISLCPDWYVDHRSAQGASVQGFDRHSFFAAWWSILEPLDAHPLTLVLRDFHSPNLLWQEGEDGIARIGIIDHQDAMLGPPAYDVASLVQDARVTVEPGLQDKLLSHYVQMRSQGAADFEEDRFRAAFAIMAAQRCTKVLGIFARLNARDGKPHYLAHLPRIETYLRQVLTHPALAPLRPHYEALLPGGLA